MAESSEGEYEAVMPFVLTKSQGGPFDDGAFVAGMTCGALDQELTITAALHTLPRERYIDARFLKQVDLIAMRHGYRIELGDLDEPSGWQVVRFEWGETEIDNG
ncbi:hypothetical protein [Streptomyces spinosisporus]|uniref:Uncharacterized protein n=1 Tax=Streptomyces spinosisporus TaxID=2927582 RepID=A0ABS9XW28_9ACTN|nr:hypothetical protein [Streptomyces spinosisporus]MCI3246288.1 hypothetical protein [Streptomyces spinosisporus]